ncbi:TorF family putative porin [Sphingobium bisphenolivorans]|uniref:TorF family putative porin n=1 Tax=Sphingobium bisphenolivorans TaxID=1335760 RepID=UPI0003998CB7|nr:TorF family putative porin [Sphingobium bisphenolivorans]
MFASVSAQPALAQYADGVSATVELASEERRRGLGWSDGDPVVRGTLSIPIVEGLSLEGTAVSLWHSSRHGGADAAIDLGAAYVRQIGGWRFWAEGRYHLFPGASHQGYGEAGAGAGFLIGPAAIDLSGSYAPRQSAIGGDNLYLAASAAMGLPGTPLTVSARIGRSSGDVRNPVSAMRLRPDGAYWDHGVSLDYLKGRWFAGLRYANSSIDGPGAKHAGASLIGRVGLSL